MGCIRVPQAIGDSRLVEIVGAHFHFHHVARGDLDEVFSKFPRDMSKHRMAIPQLHPKHRAGQHRDYLSFNLDRLVFGHIGPDAAQPEGFASKQLLRVSPERRQRVKV